MESRLTGCRVLVATGVGQIGLGAGQARLAPVAPSVGFTAVECALWNGGCLIVISGTLLSNPTAVSIGSGLLVAALGMSTFEVRGSGGQPLLLLLYRGLLIVLLASIPIGTALAWTKTLKSIVATSTSADGRHSTAATRPFESVLPPLCPDENASLRMSAGRDVDCVLQARMRRR